MYENYDNIIENDFTSPERNYEKWVDNLIEEHKNRLNKLKFQRSKNDLNNDHLESQENSENHSINKLYKNENFSLQEKFYSSQNFDEKFISTSDNEISIVLDKSEKNLKQTFDFTHDKMINLLNSYIEENAKLKLELKELDKTVIHLKRNCLKHKKEIVKNSDIFIKRERNMVETLNLLEFENKRLQDKLKESTNELENFKKVRESLYTFKEKELIYPENKIECLYSTESRMRNQNLNSDLDLKCFSYEKVIEIFLNLFDKYDVTNDLRRIVHISDFEELKKKMNEFENFIKSKINLKKEENRTTQEIDNSLNKAFGFNTSAQKRILRISSTDKLKPEHNKHTEQSIKKTKDFQLNENDFYVKLENRLTQLENTLQNYYNEEKNSANFPNTTEMINYTESKNSEPNKNKNKLEKKPLLNSSKKQMLNNFNNGSKKPREKFKNMRF